jgi:uncharacterized protein (TIGR02147 family)
MQLLKCENYKDYVRHRIKEGARGGFQALAQELGVHPSMVSQVFRGKKHLTPEQASRTAQFLGLGRTEKSYFVQLVLRDRAQSSDLREVLDQQLCALREQESEPAERTSQPTLSDRDKAMFYSNWFFSAVRLSTHVPRLRTLDRIADYLSLPKDLVRQILEFLLATGLVRETRDGLELGPKNTVLELDSPFLPRHHSNWRMRGLERMATLRPHEMFFTCPMVIGRKESIEIRKLIERLIADMDHVLTTSKPEKVACLNVDWFDVI